jgi:hypothetical protein
VIDSTEGKRRGALYMRCELGEWGAREMARQTPNPRTKAPFRLSPGRSPAVTIARLCTLSHDRNAVQYLTTPAGG